MSGDGETLSAGQYVDRTIALLEKAEAVRLDAQHKAQSAVASGYFAHLWTDPRSLLYSAKEELDTLKYRFDDMARPLVHVAYYLDIDAAPLDDFIRTGEQRLVAETIRVLRRVQGKVLKQQVSPIQSVTPKSDAIDLDALAEQERSQPTHWECDALITLAERNLWPVDQLPDTVDVDVLRCLDERRWVEARYIVMNNQQKYPGDPTPPTPGRSVWFSPLKQPSMTGTWEKFLTSHQSDQKRCPGEVRVSEMGKAYLTRRHRELVAIKPEEVTRLPRPELDAQATGDDKGNESPQPQASASDKRLEWLAKAMLLVNEHPDWSDAEIARQVDRNPGTLSRSKQYQAAAKMARGDKTSVRRGHIRVDPDSGLSDVEAVDHNATASDDKSDRGQAIEGSKYIREYCAECEDPIKVTRDKVGTNPKCDRCSG